MITRSIFFTSRFFWRFDYHQVHHPDIPQRPTHVLAKGQYSLDDYLLKAQVLESGQRWITVHPNGKDNKGVPVMVQEAQHGSGVYHVIGGAGGKLNGAGSRGVTPEEMELTRLRAENGRIKRALEIIKKRRRTSRRMHGDVRLDSRTRKVVCSVRNVWCSRGQRQ